MKRVPVTLPEAIVEEIERGVKNRSKFLLTVVPLTGTPAGARCIPLRVRVTRAC